VARIFVTVSFHLQDEQVVMSIAIATMAFSFKQRLIILTGLVDHAGSIDYWRFASRLAFSLWSSSIRNNKLE
jgi:hypothetical protein